MDIPLKKINPAKTSIFPLITYSRHILAYLMTELRNLIRIFYNSGRWFRIMLNVINHNSLQGALFYFTLYSFLGWFLENSYSFFTKEGFFKSNFLKGPFKPMYGFAPVLLLFLIPKHPHWSVILFLCFFIPTLVEYLSGVMLKKLFNRQYWDYSTIPLQLHGHICLPFSICWIFLSFICLQWIHPAVSSLFGTMELYWGWVYPAIIFYFLTELILAIRRHSYTAISAEKPTNTV